MKKQFIVALVGGLLVGAMQAQAVDSYWIGTSGDAFENINNWSAGIPNWVANIDGFVTNGATVVLSTDLNSPAAGRVRKVSIDSGTLDIASGGNLQTRTTGFPKVNVGVGAGNVGYLNIANGGAITLKGIGADLIIGDAAGGQGFVTVAEWAKFLAQKSLEIINGKLTFAPNVDWDGGNIGNGLVVANNGTLAFKTDGTTISTIPGAYTPEGDAKLPVELGETSTLDMQLGGSYAIGDSWKILTNVASFTGVFGTVYDSTNPGNNFKVHYGNGLAAAGEVVIELVPEATEFTNEGGDGTWANAANWSSGVPKISSPATVNGSRTANLSGGTGNANSISAGTVDGETGTVQNGSLVVVGATELGSAANASGILNLTTYTAGTLADGLTLASGADSIGSLTAGSATISAETVSLATGSNSVGTLALTSGTVTAGGAVNIATGQDSTATVATGTDFVLASTNSLHVGTGSGASHNLTAANFTITGPLGDFAVGAGTGSSIMSLYSANDTIGSITANAPLELTGGNHLVNGLFIAAGTGSTGSLEISGSATATFSGAVDLASGENSSAVLDLSTLDAESFTAAKVNVARGNLAVGSLNYPDGNLILTGDMELGTDAEGSEATVLLGSLGGGKTLSLAQKGVGITAHMTVLGDSSNGIVRVGRSLNSVASLTVGGTLTAGQYLNTASVESNAVASITAKTINKTAQNGSIGVAQGALTNGRITAEDGILQGRDLLVASGDGSVGEFAITNGTVSMQLGSSLNLAMGADSTGTIWVGVNGDDIVVNIGTGTNATGTLTLPNGTLTAKSLVLGSAEAGVGIINLAGGNLVITNEVISIGASSYIDLTDTASTLTWTDKTGDDFEALWNAGKLRSDGRTGPESVFSNYFTISGATISPTGVIPPGVIAIAKDPSGVAIAWNGVAGQTYKIWVSNNLLLGSWTEKTTVVGVDGPMSVVVPATDPVTFYRVTSQ